MMLVVRSQDRAAFHSSSSFKEAISVRRLFLFRLARSLSRSFGLALLGSFLSKKPAGKPPSSGSSLSEVETSSSGGAKAFGSTMRLTWTSPGIVPPEYFFPFFPPGIFGPLPGLPFLPGGPLTGRTIAPGCVNGADDFCRRRRVHGLMPKRYRRRRNVTGPNTARMKKGGLPEGGGAGLGLSACQRKR